MSVYNIDFYGLKLHDLLIRMQFINTFIFHLFLAFLPLFLFSGCCRRLSLQQILKTLVSELNSQQNTSDRYLFERKEMKNTFSKQQIFSKLNSFFPLIYFNVISVVFGILKENSILRLWKWLPNLVYQNDTRREFIVLLYEILHMTWLPIAFWSFPFRGLWKKCLRYLIWKFIKIIPDTTRFHSTPKVIIKIFW